MRQPFIFVLKCLDLKCLFLKVLILSFLSCFTSFPFSSSSSLHPLLPPPSPPLPSFFSLYLSSFFLCSLMPQDAGDSPSPRPEFRVIEMGMLNKSLFFPLSSAGYLTCHWMLYPFTMIRTRLQVQEKNSLYRGMFHAFRVISTEEGVRALYRGVYVKSVQVLSGIFYIGTYESEWCVMCSWIFIDS